MSSKIVGETVIAVTPLVCSLFIVEVTTTYVAA